nr:MAG TPA: hypothetical protein [Caudoviricetes sp.]
MNFSIFYKKCYLSIEKSITELSSVRIPILFREFRDKIELFYFFSIPVPIDLMPI